MVNYEGFNGSVFKYIFRLTHNIQIPQEGTVDTCFVGLGCS